MNMYIVHVYIVCAVLPMCRIADTLNVDEDHTFGVNILADDLSKKLSQS